MFFAEACNSMQEMPSVGRKQSHERVGFSAKSDAAARSICSGYSFASIAQERTSQSSVSAPSEGAVQKLRQAFLKRIDVAGGNPLEIFPGAACIHEDSGRNRADMGTCITKSMFKDSKEVLAEKLDYLLLMVTQSEELCAYCGAGLSTNAGISDYATNGTERKNFSPSSDPHIEWLKELPPTIGHKMLSALQRHGKLKQVINQNHDALLQKAGFPLEKINEIHGSWFDHRNPVVAMGGSMRKDLVERMEFWAGKADVVLTLGTSLSGLTADMLPELCSQRNMDKEGHIIDPFKGLVIVNHQRTRLDYFATLRIFADIDEVMIGLVERLGIENLVPSFAEINRLRRRGMRFREYALYYEGQKDYIKSETKRQIAARAQPTY